MQTAVLWRQRQRSVQTNTRGADERPVFTAAEVAGAAVCKSRRAGSPIRVSGEMDITIGG